MIHRTAEGTKHNVLVKAFALLFAVLVLTFAVSSPAMAAEATEEDTSVLEDVANAAIGGVAGLIGEGIVYGLGKTFELVTDSSTVTVSQNCSAGAVGCWFESQYQLMKTIGVAVMVPMALIAIIQATTKGSLFQMVKSILIFLPIAFIGTAVAAQFVQLLVDITDQFSNVFVQSSQENLGAAIENINAFFTTGGEESATVAILMVILAIPMYLACIFVWLILILRSASIYIATLFLPIAFATLIWPAAARSFRRLVEFLIAMILSKLVMVAGLSLAMASFSAIGADPTAGSVGLDGSPIAAGATDTGPFNATTLNQIILFTAMLIVVAFAPQTLMKFLGNFSMQEAAGALGDHLRRPSLVNQVLFLGRAQELAKSPKAMKDSRAARVKTESEMKNTSQMAAVLSYAGITKQTKPGYETGFEITVKDLQDTQSQHQLSAKMQQEIINLSHSDNIDDVMLAHNLYTMSLDSNVTITGFNKMDANNTFASIQREVDDGYGNITKQSAVMSNLSSRKGKLAIKDDPKAIQRFAKKQLETGVADHVVFIAAAPGRNQADQDRGVVVREAGKNLYTTIASAQGRSSLRDMAIDTRTYRGKGVYD